MTQTGARARRKLSVRHCLARDCLGGNEAAGGTGRAGRGGAERLMWEQRVLLPPGVAINIVRFMCECLEHRCLEEPVGVAEECICR